MAWIQENMINILIAALLAWMLWSRLLAPKLSGVKSMSASDYLNFRHENHAIVDVRSASEWQSGHPSQARHIPLGEVGKRMEELDKSQPIVVICASGARSSMAATQLAKAGFDTVYNFSGGMGSWQSAGLPTKKGR